MILRKPAVAGRFYPGEAAALKQEIDRHVPRGVTRRTALGVLSPHAGFIYSGSVAGAVYASVEIPRRIVILCPNHTGRGAALAVQSTGIWRTPLGDVTVDESLALAIRERCPLEEDTDAHAHEHSLEVQLPFLQYFRNDFLLVPICVGTGDLPRLLALGDGLAETLAALDEPALLVASSDMSHYESEAVAEKKDRRAIDRMIALDPEGLFRVVRENAISMCGYAPATAVMQACRRLGATVGDLVRYTTSAEVSGDRHSVVGYAGIRFLASAE